MIQLFLGFLISLTYFAAQVGIVTAATIFTAAIVIRLLK